MLLHCRKKVSLTKCSILLFLPHLTFLLFGLYPVFLCADVIEGIRDNIIKKNERIET